MPDIYRIDAVFLEQPPFVHGIDRDEIDAEHAALDAAYVAVLNDLLTKQDAMSCENCDERIGFVLAYYAPADSERLEWRTTALAREDGGPVVALCEDCAPYVPPLHETVPDLVEGR